MSVDLNFWFLFVLFALSILWKEGDVNSGYKA